MSQVEETFFTSVGCMDGRVQNAVNSYASLVFGAEYPDTVTKAGLDGLLAHDELDQNEHDSVEKMIMVSVDKHKSVGIVVHGHEHCAKNPVEEKQHKIDIKKSVLKVKKMLKGKKVEVKGVYIRLSPRVRIIDVV
jgi:carbonic anhydrase